MAADTQGSAPTRKSSPSPSTGRYDAFISYSHDDRFVAAGIQKGLHRIARPMGRLNALRVSRCRSRSSPRSVVWVANQGPAVEGQAGPSTPAVMATARTTP